MPISALAALASAQRQRENVFLFIPNVIGYIRLITAAVSLYYMPFHPIYSSTMYFVSCILDAIDGYAARLLNQSTRFGAVLDMVLDRCTTACLFAHLVSTYPKYALVFQALLTLDFSSHYIHMVASQMTGAASHKAIKSDVSRILWLYYNDKRTLFTFCFGNEAFFLLLYLVYWRRETWITWGLILSAPIMLAKQIVNVVQFWKAAKILVGIDLQERQTLNKKAQ